MSGFSAAGIATLKRIAAQFRDREDLSLAPTADFTFAAAGLQVTFTDASSDPDLKNTLTWAWDFGDGATATTQNPVHTYAGAGTYNVTLTVTDPSSKTGQVTKPVTV